MHGDGEALGLLTYCGRRMDRMEEVGEFDFAHCDPFRNIKMEILPSIRPWRREHRLDKMASTIDEVHNWQCSSLQCSYKLKIIMNETAISRMAEKMGMEGENELEKKFDSRFLFRRTNAGECGRMK